MTDAGCARNPRRRRASLRLARLPRFACAASRGPGLRSATIRRRRQGEGKSEHSRYPLILAPATAIMWGSSYTRLGCMNSLAHDTCQPPAAKVVSVGLLPLWLSFPLLRGESSIPKMGKQLFGNCGSNRKNVVWSTRGR